MQKGIKIPFDQLAKLWKRHYEYDGYHVVIPEDYIIEEHALRLVYNKDLAAIVEVPQATTGMLPMRQDTKEDDFSKTIDALENGGVAVIRGPIHATIAALSNKKAVIRLVGKGGEIAIWQEATSRKHGHFKGIFWGMECRLSTYKFSGEAKYGEVFDMQQAIQWYKRMTTILKVL